MLLTLSICFFFGYYHLKYVYMIQSCANTASGEMPQCSRQYKHITSHCHSFSPHPCKARKPWKERDQSLDTSLPLQRHADPLLTNVKGETPLDLAAQYGHLDTVHLLISHWPEILQLSREAFSPLHLAARNGHTLVALSLINAGISINTRVSTAQGELVVGM